MLELPRPLPWADRVASMPYISGGGDAQLTSLRRLLERVQQDGADPDIAREVERARPRGFVERTGRGRWTVTDAGLKWLESDDPAFLIGVFHSEIRFIGELLDMLRSSGEMTHTQLVDMAKLEYNLAWNSPDQVRRRTTWLRATGHVELRFDNYIVLNEAAIELLERIEIRQPNSLLSNSHPVVQKVILEPPPPQLREALGRLDMDTLRSRRRLIGFMPGGKSGIDSLRRMVNETVPRVAREQWAKRCNELFALAESSAYQALGSFRGVGLLRQVDKDVDAPTAEAEEWVQTGSDIDLIRLLHVNTRFFGEILSFLDRSESATELATKALEFRIPATDLHRRLGLLLAAGCIEESGIRRFRVTPTGQALVDELPLETIDIAAASTVDEEESREEELSNASEIRYSVQHLETELNQAVRAAHDHKRLEIAVTDSFAFLGFETEHLGGQSRTDVRARSLLAGDDSFVVIADAKASAKGQVAPFDVTSLREHKEQHGADYVIAIGENFADRRTKDRARSEGVGLLTVENLCVMLRAMSSGLMGVRDLRKLLATKGLIEGHAIDDLCEKGRRQQKIAQMVLSTLAVEGAGDDEVTKGSLSPSEIYMQLRNQTDAPSLEEINSVLELLASPLVRGVERRHEKYLLAEHVVVVAGRLRALSIRMSGAETVGG